jgi:hypothetical protein
MPLGASAPTAEQQRILESLVGLPFVVCTRHPAWKNKVVGEMSNGTKVRAEFVQELFNAALVVDAIDGPGAYRRNMASPEQLEVLAMAERLYGCNLSVALTRWLAMERLEYFDWANRPEVAWSGAVPLVN